MMKAVLTLSITAVFSAATFAQVCNPESKISNVKFNQFAFELGYVKFKKYDDEINQMFGLEIGKTYML